MFAVIKAGAHQYTVKEGDQIDIDRLDGKDGDSITFDQVLMVRDTSLKIGAPLVKGAKVEAVIKKQYRAPKILVFKYMRTKNSKVTRGHRQPQTTVEITKIQS